VNRDDFEPSPLADVEAIADGDRWTLVFVRDLHHPPEQVWAALTEPAQLGEWAPFFANRDLGSVGDAVLTMVDGDGTRLTLRHTVSDLDMAAMAAAGWHVCLDVAERLLDGTPIGPIRGAEARNFGWDQLNEAYAKTLAQ
jgi:hypothetical protein